MENEFTALMSQKTPEELIRILTVDKLDYSPIALGAAGSELEKRNLDQSAIDEIKKQLQGVAFKNLQQEPEEKLLEYAKDLSAEHKRKHEIRHIFSMGGLDKYVIDKVLYQLDLEVLQVKIEKAKKDILHGGLWLGGGLLLTILDIGYYFLGAIIFGGYQFIKGIYEYKTIKMPGEHTEALDSDI